MDMQQKQRLYLFGKHSSTKQFVVWNSLGKRQEKVVECILPLGPGSGTGRCTCHKFEVLAVKIQKLKINEAIKRSFYFGSYQPEVSRRVKHSGQIFLCHDECVGAKYAQTIRDRT